MNNERTGGAMMVLGGRPTILSGYGGDYCCKEYYKSAESYDADSGHWWLLTARFVALLKFKIDCQIVS